MTEIKFVNKSGNPEPSYQTEHSAGMDLRAHLDGEIILKPGERKLVKTGLFIELPEGFEAQVRSRSGMALKSGVAVLNSPGTIDADYRGEVGVILINHSDEDYVIKDGDRIAQMVIARYERVDLVRMNELTETSRGAGGFGHTGNI